MELSFAHGVGRVYQSPLPLWLYLVGAAATVLVSFFIRSLADRTPERREGRVVAGPVATERLLSFFRVVGLAVLGLMILFTFLDPDPGFTVTPLLFWVLLIVGTIVASSLVSGVWERTNPWATIEGLYLLDEDEREATRRLPEWLGPLLVYGLFWFELISGRGFDPAAILLVVAAYTVFALTFRRTASNWQAVDPLSILFGFASRVAPLEIDDERGLVARGLAGLDERRPMPWALFASVLVLLASTTLDNLRETVEWTTFLEATGLEHLNATVVDSAFLVLLTLPFLITFVAAIAVSARWMTASLSTAARTFGWSLIPIGIAYVLAHNMPLLIIGVPALIDRVVDSLGIDAFATYAPSPQLVWILAIVLVVGGHVLGVLAAHRAALTLTDSHRAAVRSHTALTVLMSLYTVSTLWLLSLPLVTES